MFETKTTHELFKEFDVNPKEGLSSEEAARRKEQYGKNALAEKKRKNFFLIFLSQLNDPMIYILLAAALISLGIAIYEVISAAGDEGGIESFADVIIIVAVILLNAIIGTIQEIKAENALEALKKLSSPESHVRRDGKLVKIKSEDLVPGDILILEEGDTIGADVRLIETHNFKTDESSLTGESLPVEKDASYVFNEDVGAGDRINCAYMSTPSVYGRAEGVVVATGMQSEIGKIASMLAEEKDEQTPLQKRLADLSKLLGILAIVIIVLMFAVGLIYEAVAATLGVNSVITLFMNAIALAVAAVPEGLPAVVTIVLAVGVQRMVKANTIVRKLPSVETLGAVSFVCSDKTGTLTQNKMTVTKIYVNGAIINSSDFDENNCALLAKGMALCSNASIENGIHGDPTEIALVEFAEKVGLKKSALEEKCPRIEEIPFDSNRKMMSTLHNDVDGPVMFTKGAIDNILKHTTHIYLDGKEKPITKDDIKCLEKKASEFSKAALRVLALAYRKTSKLEEEKLVFVGFVGMVDPARPEAKHAVDIFKNAGITTVMITGDHKDTAYAIASELGICNSPEQCLSGSELDNLSDEEVAEKVRNIRVFARVSPENKVQIVKAFKANGSIVAMTGDGVNDAPSLKAADIGIAMGITGTDVAKGAADMVLTDDNFASIEKAVEEGRGIYANIKKTVWFLLSSNVGEVISMFVAVLIGLPSPLVAIQILWVNLITDSLPAIALGSDTKDKDIMKEQPRGIKESLFSRGGYATIFGYGAFIGLITLLAFLLFPMIELSNNGQTITLQSIINILNDPSYEWLLRKSETMAFSVLGISQLFHMLGIRNIRKSFVVGLKNINWFLIVSFFAGIALQVIVVEVPGISDFFNCYQIDGIEWLYVFAFAVSPLVIHEIVVLILFIVNKIRTRKVDAIKK